MQRSRMSRRERFYNHLFWMDRYRWYGVKIGRLEISVAAPRATEMVQGGLLGTGDTCNTMFTHGGMKSTYSITDVTGLRFTTTTGTAEIESGRFSLYGIGQ